MNRARILTVLVLACMAAPRPSAPAEGNSPALTISLPRQVFHEEEEVRIVLDIRNDTAEEILLDVPCLQPREARNIFVGETARLSATAGTNEITGFTNHMPPEPRPGTTHLIIQPGQVDRWFIPFPHDYYPVPLPAEFRVSLAWRGRVSNEVSFSVLPSEGTSAPGNILLNGTFSAGGTFPYGWKLSGRSVSWNHAHLHYSLDAATAHGEGAWVLSLFRPVRCPASYILEVRARTTGPRIIVFVEGWGPVSGRKRRIERTECFLHDEGGDWQTYALAFAFENPGVRWIRVKPYAYGTPGEVFFDFISVRPADTEPTGGK